MRTKIIEAAQSAKGPNWGKFLLGRLDTEFDAPSVIDQRWPLMRRCGWSGDEFLAMDLQTGEGALFRTPGSAMADLEKRNIWVCPMFLPWLETVYRMGLDYMFGLDPALVIIPDAEFRLAGVRHGQREAALTLVRDLSRLDLSGEPEGHEIDPEDALQALTSYVLAARELLA